MVLFALLKPFLSRVILSREELEDADDDDGEELAWEREKKHALLCSPKANIKMTVFTSGSIAAKNLTIRLLVRESRVAFLMIFTTRVNSYNQMWCKCVGEYGICDINTIVNIKLSFTI